MNSTLRPSADGNTWRIDCNFFDPFDILAPEILLRDEGLGSAAPPNNNHIMDYNYVYIERPVDRYYFINKWERIKGIWHGYTSEDVLASWRSTILESQQYIIRSSIKWHDYIPDTFYGYNFNGYNTTAKYFHQLAESPNTWAFSPSKLNTEYRLILEVNSIGYADKPWGERSPKKDTGTHKNVSRYYAWQGSCVKNIIREMQKDTGNIFEQDTDHSLNLNDYILRAFFLPVDIKKSSQAENIDANVLAWGSYDDWTNAKDRRAFGEVWNDDGGVYTPLLLLKRGVVVQIDWEVDISEFKSPITYQNSNTYLKYIISFNPFGMIEIDANDLIYNSAIHLRAKIDVQTGNAILFLVKNVKEAVESEIILSTANVAVDIPLSSMQRNSAEYKRNVISNAVSAIGSVIGAATGYGAAEMAKNATADAIELSKYSRAEQGATGAASGALGLMMQPPATIIPSTTGISGSYLIDDTPTLIVKRFSLVDRDDARFGRPLCEKLILGSQLTGATGANNYTIAHPGLVVCQGAQIKSGTGTEIGQGILAAERAAIESALNGGVYLE